VSILARHVGAFLELADPLPRPRPARRRPVYLLTLWRRHGLRTFDADRATIRDGHPVPSSLPRRGPLRRRYLASMVAATAPPFTDWKSQFTSTPMAAGIRVTMNGVSGWTDSIRTEGRCESPVDFTGSYSHRGCGLWWASCGFYWVSAIAIISFRISVLRDYSRGLYWAALLVEKSNISPSICSHKSPR
jgi:hypothetical protein